MGVIPNETGLSIVPINDVKYKRIRYEARLKGTNRWFPTGWSQRVRTPALDQLYTLPGSWYDAKDITSSTQQQIASRLDSSHLATRGATTGAETSDPGFDATAKQWTFDGGDHLQLPVSDRPNWTHTAGQSTVIVAGMFSATPTSSFNRIWSSESASNNGAGLLMWSSGTRQIRALAGQGTSTVNAVGGDWVDNTLWVAAHIVDNGVLRCYFNASGTGTMSASVSMSTLTALAHHTSGPRLGGAAYGGNSITGTLYVCRRVSGRALTLAELNDIAAELRSRAYP